MHDAADGHHARWGGSLELGRQQARKRESAQEVDLWREKQKRARRQVRRRSRTSRGRRGRSEGRTIAEPPTPSLV